MAIMQVSQGATQFRDGSMSPSRSHGEAVWDPWAEREAKENRDFAGMQGDAQRANGLAQAEIGIRPGMLAAANQQQRFGRVFPWLTSQWGALQGGMSGTAGGQSGPGPTITAQGVLNPQQINQQVNAMRAGNDQSGQSQMMQQSRDVAGRGFGSNSPLLAALHGQTQANTLGENVGGEREIRLGAAERNAGQLLQSQVAQENQYASRMREDIERRKPYFSLASSLLQSLSGIV